jgi:hypothetical protein
MYIFYIMMFNNVVTGMIRNNDMRIADRDGKILFGGARLKDHYEPMTSFIIAAPSTLAMPTPSFKGGAHASIMGPANNVLDANLAVLPAEKGGALPAAARLGGGLKKKAVKMAEDLSKHIEGLNEDDFSGHDKKVIQKVKLGAKMTKANIERVKKLKSGGKVNRLNKAKKWTGFVQDDIISAGLDNAKKAVGVYSGYNKAKMGMGVKSVEDAHKMLGAGRKKSASAKPSAWIQHVKKYASDHKVSYKEAMSKAKASYKK